MMEEDQESLFGPGTDLVFSLAAIFILLFFLSLGLLQDLIGFLDPKDYKEAYENCSDQYKDCKESEKECRESLEGCNRDKKLCEQDREEFKNNWLGCIKEAKEKEQPPLITLDEASYTFKFTIGSAELSPAFKNELLTTIIPKIEKLATEHNCDTLEIYGHTDGQAYGAYPPQDFDNVFHKGLEGHGFSRVSPSSNLELGMLRAGSLLEFLRQERVANIRYYRVYSAGQFILPNGTLAHSLQNGNDPERRRIEIRLSRSKDLYRSP